MVNFTVTPGSGGNGAISPNTAQTVASGATTSFTVTPDAGYSASMSGTCGGTLVSNIFTTAAIVADCSVVASFVSAPPILLAVQSRKSHGGTEFDLRVDTTKLITEAVSVEPRAIGAGHTIVFQFNQAITISGTASSTSGTVMAQIVGKELRISLTGVADNSRATVSVAGVNGNGTERASIGFLNGDVNNTRSVNSSDISAVKARSGQTASAVNFQYDVNASGAINSADISAVKARSGLVLP